jgi:hypothetical protein
MIKRILLLLLFVSYQWIYCFAQSSAPPKTIDKETIADQLQNFLVFTCFQSRHLELLLAKAAKRDSAQSKKSFFRAIKLSDAEFASLKPTEKFIYAHEHPEDYMQICSFFETAQDMSKLFANLPMQIQGLQMSRRQKQSLRDNRDTVIACLEKCIDFNSHVPLAYKQSILEINAWEFIPSLLILEDKMNKKNSLLVKDPYLYSVLMLLMKNSEFSEFKETFLYKTLYGDKAGYRSTINFTPGLRQQIVDLSNHFYKWKTAAK